MGNGDRITQWDCVNQPNVKLKLLSTGDGYYFLQFQHSGKCVQRYGGQTGNGDPINQWDCQNWPNIKLKLVPTGDGYYFLQFQHSGKCVHQFGATMGNGDPIRNGKCRRTSRSVKVKSSRAKPRRLRRGGPRQPRSRRNQQAYDHDGGERPAQVRRYRRGPHRCGPCAGRRPGDRRRRRRGAIGPGGRRGGSRPRRPAPGRRWRRGGRGRSRGPSPCPTGRRP